MAIYQRGQSWYIDFTFRGQRIRESIERRDQTEPRKVVHLRG